MEIDQIAKSAKATGNVYVSVQGKDELESERTEKSIRCRNNSSAGGVKY
ncbi:hypothetical protein ACT7CW_20390 [Bacillus pacificus]